jgi:hypothetical protein
VYLRNQKENPLVVERKAKRVSNQATNQVSDLSLTLKRMEVPITMLTRIRNLHTLTTSSKNTATTSTNLPKMEGNQKTLHQWLASRIVPVTITIMENNKDTQPLHHMM